MLTAALEILTVAVLLGSVLAVMHLRADGAAPPPWPLAALHGIVGVLGLGCLVLALREPPRGLAQDTAAFGMIAVILIAAAALLGMSLVAARLRRRRLPGLLIGIHATLAVGGFVVLTVYVLGG